MDKGAREREKALHVKRIIGQTKLRRRQRRLHRTPERMELELGPLPVGQAFLLRLPQSSSTQGTAVMKSGMATQDRPQLGIRAGDLSTFDERTLSEPSRNVTLPAESFFNQNQRPSDADTAVENTDMDSIYGSSQSSGKASPSTNTSLSICEVNSQAGIETSGNVQFEANVPVPVPFCEPKLDTSYNDSHLLREPTFGNEASSFSSFQKNRSPMSQPSGYYTSRLTAPSQSILCADAEDILFMHYLDQVFHIQYPFYHSATRQERGWLFSILMRVKSAYHAALALSEHHRYSTLPQKSGFANNLGSLQAKGGHYDLALREIQLFIGQSHMWTGTTGLVRRIEALTCILQLLFWEVRLHALLAIVLYADTQKLFSGGRRNWQMHLGAAAALVPALAQAQIACITPSSITSGHENRPQDNRILHSEDSSAARLLLGSFISFDIISCASTRSSHFLLLDHKIMLENAGVHLETLTGCRNWAMVFIFEISSLDSWKKEAEKTHKLSVVELTKRGGKIEKRLRERLADTDNESSIAASGTLMAATYTQITKIFALSALTYLHVVMSGACPELPEIIDSVSKTTDAFQRLPDKKLLRNLVWPFCISGCLALEGQQTVFRELVSAADITQSTVGTCFEAFKIMKECWEMRKTCSYNCDWVSVMNKRGYCVLLA